MEQPPPPLNYYRHHFVVSLVAGLFLCWCQRTVCGVMSGFCITPHIITTHHHRQQQPQDKNATRKWLCNGGHSALQSMHTADHSVCHMTTIFRLRARFCEATLPCTNHRSPQDHSVPSTQLHSGYHCPQTTARRKKHITMLTVFFGLFSPFLL